MLTTDVETPAILNKFLNVILKLEIIPIEWKQAIDIKIPEKGQLIDCGNKRGIRLSLISLKIFRKILLNHMEEIIDQILRKRQTGFKKGRRCLLHIFAVKLIVEYHKGY